MRTCHSQRINKNIAVNDAYHGKRKEEERKGKTERRERRGRTKRREEKRR